VQNYAQAIRALRTGNGEAALQKLNASGNDLAVTLAKAQAYNLLHQYDATEKLLLPLANSRPENEALLTTLSEALVANGKAAQAWQLMNRHHLTEISSLEFLEARQRTAEAAGQTAEAYISAAERSLRMGEYRHAQAALEQASRIPGTPAPTVARLQAMANQMQNAEKQDKQAGKL
jgi:predicted Zn-dependent protease